MFEQLAKEKHVPEAAWAVAAGEAMLAIAEGRLGNAEGTINHALAIGQDAGSADSVTAYGAQLYAVRWLQGRIDEMEAPFRLAQEQSPNVSVYPAALALMCIESGRPRDGVQLFEPLAVHASTSILMDFLWMVTVVCLVEVCTALNDSARASDLYALLLPHAEQNAGVAFVLSVGSASRSLGLLATVLERWDDAERHFEDAIEMNERMGFRPWTAMTRLNYATMLLRRNGPGDGERARTLLSESLAAADEIGMAKVAADCRELLATRD
jgi:tetratricopeptide (TPR) repeat protein